MTTVPFHALQRSPTRWLLVRGDTTSEGHLHRAGVAHLVHRADGRWEWRAAGAHQVAETREAAELAVVAAWLNAAPVQEVQGRCAYCTEELPKGSTTRRKFCGAPCRVSFKRAREAGPEAAVRVRKRSVRKAASRVERAAARARAQEEPGNAPRGGAAASLAADVVNG